MAYNLPLRKTAFFLVEIQVQMTKVKGQMTEVEVLVVGIRRTQLPDDPRNRRRNIHIPYSDEKFLYL